MDIHTKNIRDLIAALQLVVKEHGSNLTLGTLPDDADVEEQDSALIVYGADGVEVVTIWLDCRETDTCLLAAVTRIPPNAHRKNRQQPPR